MREFKCKAWDTEERLMLYSNPFSSFHGCDSSDGQKNRHDRRSVMTWNGAVYNDGKLLHLIILQYTGLKTHCQAAEIYESDLLKYQNKLWMIEYSEDCAAYMLARNLTDFGENKQIQLSCDVAFESDHFGNFYLNPEVVQAEREKFINPES